MKIKTSELTGAALDWAVACAINGRPEFFETFGAKQLGRLLTMGVRRGEICPSTDWSQGGLLIERRKIEIGPSPDGWFGLTPCGAMGYAATPLIAAMRAIVADVLGDTVDVPEELAP